MSFFGNNTNGGSSILREVVGRVESTGDAGFQLGIAVVGRLHHRELEASGVLQVQMELAVLGPVGHRGAWADVRLEGIESKGDDLLLSQHMSRNTN